MPTRIVTLGRERSVTALARRIYDLPARDPALPRATAALIRANPRLRNRAAFRSGAVVVAPRVRGLKLADEVQSARTDDAAPVDETTLRLQAMSSRVADGFGQAARTRDEAREVLADRKFMLQVRRALPEATKVINTTTRRLEREEEADKESSERLARGLAEAVDAVAALNTLGRRTLG